MLLKRIVEDQVEPQMLQPCDEVELGISQSANTAAFDVHRLWQNCGLDFDLRVNIEYLKRSNTLHR
jgi:hypothetical protein